MNFVKIVCPKCSAEAKLSLVDASYVGPRRCWKCHEYFTIAIENNRVTSCEPLSKEEYERQQEAKKAAEEAKSRGGISFSSREEPEAHQVAKPEQLEFFRPPMPKEPSRRETPRQEAPRQETPKGTPGIFPPDRIQTFVPLEDTGKKLEKQKKPKEPKDPPDRFNIFIPPQT